MTPVLALICALALGFADPSAAPSSVVPTTQAVATTAPQISSWLGASLGEASKDVRTQLGKPREIIPSNVGDLWRYDIDHGNVTLELVIDQDQVVNIAARLKDGKQSSLADPLGGAIGMSAQALQAARGVPLATYDNGSDLAYGDPTGVRWFYSLDNGAVWSIEISKPLPAPPPAQVIADAAHDGSTLQRALMVKAATDADATNAEMDYLHRLPCESGGAWQVTGQELVPAGGRYYDLLHTACSTTKLTHDFYFDITDSFGK
jgi:hypothetical protein